MTSLENYALIVNQVFGQGAARFKIGGSSTNNIIGALNCLYDYQAFKINFRKRLERLKMIYESHPEYLKVIIDQVNLIADNKNYPGAYAELATYDHFNQDILRTRTFLIEPIAPNVNLAKEDSLGVDLGMQETNLDGYIKSLGLYFDVKVMKDNVNELLQGIYKQVKSKNKSLENIIAEYDMSISHSIFEDERPAIVNELNEFLSPGNNPIHLSSKIVPGISFQFHWRKQNSYALKTYHPHRHAKNHHTNMFSYAKKFLKERPTLIVLVSFPWYNQILNTKENEMFYRAYARRFFCQYKDDQTPYKNLNSAFTGNQSISEVTKHLSGIVFLEDKLILSTTPEETNVKCSVYLNPNANNKIKGTFTEDYLHSICNQNYDDFDFDNY